VSGMCNSLFSLAAFTSKTNSLPHMTCHRVDINVVSMSCIMHVLTIPKRNGSDSTALPSHTPPAVRLCGWVSSALLGTRRFQNYVVAIDSQHWL
jgi:hypothetical protein